MSGLGSKLGLQRFQQGTLLNYANQIISAFGDKIVAMWPLDDLSGTAARDASTNNLPAAYASTVQLQQDGIGSTKCVNFAATGALNVYSIAIRDEFNGKEGFIGLWVSPNSAADWIDGNRYLAFLYADTNNKLQLRHTAGNILSFLYYGSSTFKSINFAAPQTSKWLNIGLRWSFSDGKATVFVNGIEFQSVSGITEWIGNLVSNFCYVMSANNQLTKFNGKAQLVTLLNRAPTNQEVINAIKPRGVFSFPCDSRSNQKMWHSIAAEATTFNSELCYGGYGISNTAVSGDTIALITARLAATNAFALLGKTNVLCVWMGVNSSNLTATQIYEGIRDYCLAARATWQKIVVFTETPAQDAGSITNGWEAKRLEVNINLRANYATFCDVIADIGDAPELQNPLDTTYFLADKIHLTDAGYTVVGTIGNAAISTLGLT